MSETGYDGSIVINTKLDNTTLNKGLAGTSKELDKLTTQFDKQVNSIRRQELALSAMQKKLDAIMAGTKKPQELVEMERQLKVIAEDTKAIEKENAALLTQYNDLVKTADDLRNTGFKPEQMTGLIEEIDKLAVQLDPVFDKFNALEDEATKIKQAMEEMRLAPETSFEAEQLAEKMSIAENNLAHSRDRANELRQKMEEASKVNVGKLVAGLKGVAKYAVKAVGGVIALAKNVKPLGGHARGAASGFEKMGNRIKAMIMTVGIFSVIRKAITALRNQLSALVMANSEFAASWNAVKVNMLSAFSPIWETIQPALVAFMQVLADVTSWLAAFMSMLFGKSLSQSKAGAKAMNEQAKAIKGVGSAAKEASKFLFDFDKIQKIPSENAGGGAGAGSLDFENVEPPSPAILEWIDELMRRLKSIEPDVDYFRELGFKIGQSVSDWLDNIPWADIKQRAETFGRELAGFLTGALVDSDIIPKIGTTLGELINTGLYFAFGFLDEGKIQGLFIGLGRRLGEGINNMFATIEWELLGATFAAFIMAIVDIAFGLFTTMNWSGYAKDISTAINTLFADLDFKKIGETFSLGIRGVFAFIKTALWEIDWGAIGKSIGEFLGSIDWAGIIADLFAIIGEVVLAAVHIIFGFIDGLAESNPLLMSILYVVGLLGLAWVLYSAQVTLASIAGGAWNIVAGIGAAVTTAFGAAVAFLTSPITLVVLAIGALVAIVYLLIKHWETVKEWAGIAWEFISTIFGAAAEWFNTNVIQPIVGFFLWLGEAIMAGIRALFDGIIFIFVVLPLWFFENVTMPIIEFFVGFFTQIGDGFIALWDGIVAVWSAVAAWFNTYIVEPIANFFGGLWKGITSGASLLAEFMKTKVIDPIVSLFKGMYNSVISIVEGVINGFIGIINAFIRGINSAIDAINQIPGVSIPSIREMQTVTIPRMARGGVVPHGFYEVSEAGAEAIIPLENNTQWIDNVAARMMENFAISPEVMTNIEETGRNQVPNDKSWIGELAEALTESIGAAIPQPTGGQAQTSVVLEVDGREMGRVLLPYTDQERSRIGTRYSNRAVATV